MKKLISCLLVVLMFCAFMQMGTFPVNSYAAEDSNATVEAKATQSVDINIAIKRVKLSYSGLYSVLGEDINFLHLPLWG